MLSIATVWCIYPCAMNQSRHAIKQATHLYFDLYIYICIHVSMFLLLFLPLFNPTNKNMLLGSSSGRSLSKRQIRDRAFLTLDTIHSPHPYHQCHCSIPPSTPRTPLSARSTNKATYNLCCFIANALLCTAAHCCALKRQTKLWFHDQSKNAVTSFVLLRRSILWLRENL